jgi:thiol:disulfide interchange protein DsbD
MRLRYLRALLLLLVVAGLAPAAPKGNRSFETAVTRLETTIEPTTAARGQTVTWKLTLDLAPGWYTYPLRQADPEAELYVNSIKFLAAPGVVPVGEFVDPPHKSKAEPILKVKDLRYLPDKAVWERPLVIRPDATPGKVEVKAEVTLQVCDKLGCLLPETRTLTVPLTISDAPPVAVDPKFQAALSSPTEGPKDKGTPAAAPPPNALPSADPTSGLWGFVLAGVFWGAVSLLTPCVFPMIPITVSFFLKQSEKEHHRPITMASVYSGTIVTVLTIGGLLLIPILQPFSQHWATNFGLGILFLFFALSLFGMYEIQLPTGLANFTSAQQGRGGLVGTMFMALTFTIISFTCVAPFYGSFIALASAEQSASGWLKLLLGALAFSITFAAPFFVLALFPSLLRTLPKSGSWMNTIKVVMGFFEVAAALKFLRAGELNLLAKADFLTYDLVLGMYVALTLLCGLYLLGFFRLPHDDPLDHLGVPRLIFSLLFLSLGFYLIPGLFKHDNGEQQRPRGTVFAWLDSFLLPDEAEEAGGPQSNAVRTVRGGAKSGSRFAWIGNLEKGLQEARDKRRLVFVDFTGLT